MVNEENRKILIIQRKYIYMYVKQNKTNIVECIVRLTAYLYQVNVIKTDLLKNGTKLDR